MKVYISADIEGITGTTHWDETDMEKAEYQAAREQMTAEVAAACEGALAAGATEVLVKDAHDTGRNIIAGRLPREVRLARGWSHHPFIMSEFLDESYRAMLLIGYHSPARSGANPLSHTMTGSVHRILLNGALASEFLLTVYTAATKGVPVAFLSGDAGLCEEARLLIPQIGTVAVKEGIGEATINIHPEVAVERIREGIRKALQADVAKCKLDLPGHFTITVEYRQHMKAYRSSFYPGVRLIEPSTIQYESDDFFDIMRLVEFLV
jgi:D-amino peptidase